MSNLYRGPFTDASYQILIHLAKRLQRRRFFQKSTNQKQELSVAAMFDNGSGRNEQSLQRTCHRCFLPSFGSFSQVVSEKKIFLNRAIRNKNCLWWPCLLTNRNYSAAQTENAKSMSYQGLSQHGINEKSVKQHGHDGQNTMSLRVHHRL